jgi:hypothetical protein
MEVHMATALKERGALAGPRMEKLFGEFSQKLREQSDQSAKAYGEALAEATAQSAKARTVRERYAAFRKVFPTVVPPPILRGAPCVAVALPFVSGAPVQPDADPEYFEHYMLADPQKGKLNVMGLTWLQDTEAKQASGLFSAGNPSAYKVEDAVLYAGAYIVPPLAGAGALSIAATFVVDGGTFIDRVSLDPIAPHPEAPVGLGHVRLDVGLVADRLDGSAITAQLTNAALQYAVTSTGVGQLGAVRPPNPKSIDVVLNLQVNPWDVVMIAARAHLFVSASGNLWAGGNFSPVANIVAEPGGVSVSTITGMLC